VLNTQRTTHQYFWSSMYTWHIGSLKGSALVMHLITVGSSGTPHVHVTAVPLGISIFMKELLQRSRQYMTGSIVFGTGDSEVSCKALDGVPASKGLQLLEVDASTALPLLTESGAAVASVGDQVIKSIRFIPGTATLHTRRVTSSMSPANDYGSSLSSSTNARHLPPVVRLNVVLSHCACLPYAHHAGGMAPGSDSSDC
jgi:hypothetical protein